MPKNPMPSERRTDALSKERIVEAAITILDAEGEDALTFRTLAAHLETGPGALYWHVGDKKELLVAATDDVVARAIAAVARKSDPRKAIRAVALALFDALDAHPWMGTQLSREPWQAAVLQIFEPIGMQLRALGLPKRAQLDCASALVSYLLGLAGQYAAAARLIPRGTDRAAFLASVAERWKDLDVAEYPFVHTMAAQLPGHDDRTQFLAGIDILLAGIEARR